MRYFVQPKFWSSRRSLMTSIPTLQLRINEACLDILSYWRTINPSRWTKQNWTGLDEKTFLPLPMVFHRVLVKCFVFYHFLNNFSKLTITYKYVYCMAQATSGKIAYSDWLRRVTWRSVIFRIGPDQITGFVSHLVYERTTKLLKAFNKLSTKSCLSRAMNNLKVSFIVMKAIRTSCFTSLSRVLSTHSCRYNSIKSRDSLTIS